MKFQKGKLSLYCVGLLSLFVLSMFTATTNFSSALNAETPEENASTTPALESEKQLPKTIDNINQENARSESFTVLSATNAQAGLPVPLNGYVINDSFPEPTVEVREFTDHEMAFFSQSGNDTLRFAIKFFSYDAARFWGDAYLFKGNTQVTSAHWDENVASDTEAVALFDFCGYDIKTSGIDGPYNISLDFWKKNETAIDYYIYENTNNNNLNYTSQSYLASDFVANPITIAGFSDVSVDNDGNGLAEWLTIEVSVTATIAGEYQFDGALYTNDPNNPQDYARTYASLTNGANMVNFAFAGWKLGRITSPVQFNFSLDVWHRSFPHFHLYGDNYAYETPNTYISADFDGVPLEIIAFYEETIDSDTDGLIDYYRVTATVNVTRVEPNLQLHLLAALDTVNFTDSETVYDTWNSRSFELDSYFTANATYDFAGGLIESSSITNFKLATKFYGKLYHHDNEDWDHHTDDDWWQRDEFSALNFNSTSTYNSNEFDGIPVSLTGNYYDYGVDTDGDPYFNYLNVKIEINVLQEGSYRVNADIQREWEWQHLQGQGETSYFTLGLHNVTLQFDGYIFYANSYQTFHLGHVWLGDDKNNQFEWVHDAKTLSYTGLEFDPVPVQLTMITSEDIRKNDEDLIEALIFYVEVEVNEEGTYAIEGRLRNPITGQEYWQTTDEIEFTTQGTHSVALEFPGRWIWRQQTSTTYILEHLNIKDWDTWHNWDSLDPNFVTQQVYDSSEFVRPHATMSSVTDTPVDADGNGKFNYVRFDVEVEVFDPGTYEVRIQLENIQGRQRWSDDFYVSGFDTRHNCPSPDNYTLQVYYSSAWIYRQTAAQNFKIVNIQLVRQHPERSWEDEDVEWQNDVGTTQQYDPTDFDPQQIVFLGYGSAYALNIDPAPDTLYDYLVCEMQVNVTVAGRYHIDANLHDMSHDWLDHRGVFQGDLGLGVQTLYLKFDSRVAYETHENQSYIFGYFGFYFDLDDDPWRDDWRKVDALYRDEGEVYTPVYDYTDFQPTLIALTDNYYDYGWDNTPAVSGFSGVAVDVEVTVTKTGNYSVLLDFRNPDTDDGRWIASNMTALTPGVHNITVVCDDTAWLRSQSLNTSFEIRDIHLYLDSSSEDHYARYDGTLYTTSNYSRPDFDMSEVYLTYYFAEHIVDEDGDTLIDVINIDIGVHVAVPSAHVSIGAWLGNDTRMGMVRGSYNTEWEGWENPLTQGDHILTIRFDARQLFNQRVTSRLGLYGISVDRTDVGDWYRTDWILDPGVSLSQTIRWYECEVAPVSILGAIDDFLVDTDANGLYDYLGITYNFSVREAGEYQVESFIRYSNNDGIRSEWSGAEVQLRPGYNNVTLYWPAENLEQDGFWAFDVHVIKIYSIRGDYFESRQRGPLPHEQDFYYWYRTSEIDMSTLERSPIESIRGISATPVDLGADGLYDLLRVDVEINATAAGEYRMNAVLVDVTGGKYDHIRWATTYLKLSPGRNVATLYYQGKEIYDRGETGASYAIADFHLEKSLLALGDSVKSHWYYHVYSESDTYRYDVPGQYDYTDFSTTWYDDYADAPTPLQPTFNGDPYPSVGNYEISIDSDLAIEVEISNHHMISDVYCHFNHRDYLMTMVSPEIFQWTTFMGINLTGLYDMQIGVRDIYDNWWWGDWYQIDVVVDSPPLSIIEVETDKDGYRAFWNATVTVTVWKDSSATTAIDTVLVNYYGTWLPTQLQMSNTTHEIWTVTIFLIYMGPHDLLAVAKTGDYDDTGTKTIWVKADAPPTILLWSMSAEEINLGESIDFSAQVWDDILVTTVRVHIEGYVWMLDLRIIDTIEVWQATVTVDQQELVGFVTVRLEAIDTVGQSMFSKVRRLSVRDPGTLSIGRVTFDPSSDDYPPQYRVGTEVTMEVLVYRTEAIITSVSVFAQKPDGSQLSIALELLSDDAEQLRATYEGSIKFDKTGTWELEFRAMNTKNEIATHDEDVEVTKKPKSVSSSGFEMGLLLVSLAIVALVARCKYTKK